MIKGAVFDLDHTLFDRYATLRKITPDFCKHFDMADGMTVEKAGDMLEYADRHFVHIDWQNVFAYLKENGMFRNPPVYEEYAEFLFSSFRKTAVEFSFTKPMLTKLRDSGIKTGLITNGKRELQRVKLGLLGLEPYLDEILVSGEFGIGKPSPEPFVAMAERLGLAPGELVFVGDHPQNDIEASRRVGYTPIWIKTTGTWIYPDIEKPPIQLDDISAVPDVIAELNN